MMIGFAPEQTLFDYIAAAERLTRSKLSPEERDWAATSRNGGIPVQRFADWVGVTTSSSLLPLKEDLMSAPYSLEEIPESKQYAPPQYRKPEDQACVDMIRRMRYGFYKESEVMPAVSSTNNPSDTRPVSATLANLLDYIADLMRALTYGEMMELADAIWAKRGDGEITGESLPAVLHRWSTGA